jgi:hypothetical protein
MIINTDQTFYIGLAIITNGALFLDECKPIVFQHPYQLRKLHEEPWLGVWW